MRQYVVDAFTNKIFSGNPAAVCVLGTWPSDDVMQAVANENGLSETAFTVPSCDNPGVYDLRWFTPTSEIDLCGHATLATAAAILDFVEPDARVVRFDTRSGRLTVKRSGERYRMDFPAYNASQIEVTPQMEAAVGAPVQEAWLARDLMLVLENADDVVNAAPEEDALVALPGVLQNITAPASGNMYDCVSRTFAPKVGVLEDPVCGSAHCMIAPYWALQLGKNKLAARQASKRGGTIWCEVRKDRVALEGNAALYSVAEVRI
jgi:PhzF family phenazine biosynthesis protein